MLIENLTNYCDMNYRQKCLNENCGYCNTSCSHPTVCPQDCEQCLEQIHFPSRHPNGRLDYTCNNVLNFYVCKYFHKYASEIEYALHSINNTGKLTAVNEFYKNLIQNVIKRMQPKSIIIINDVNSNRRGRDLFLRFSDTLSKYGIRHTYSCRYFEYNIQNEYQRYGIKYPSKDILTWPTPNLARYNPWTVCSSAQLIIELE